MQVIHLHKLNIPHQSARSYARSRMIGRVVVVGFPPSTSPCFSSFSRCTGFFVGGYHMNLATVINRDNFAGCILKHFYYRFFKRVCGFLGVGNAHRTIGDIAQAVNISSDFHIAHDFLELPRIRHPQSLQHALQLIIFQNNIRAAALQVASHDVAFCFQHAAIGAAEESQKIKRHYFLADGLPCFLNGNVIKAGNGMLCEVVDEFPRVEINSAIDAVIGERTAAGVQVAVSVDNKLSIVFIRAADADIAVGGYAVAVGVGDVVVAAGGEDFCAGKVEFSNEVIAGVFRHYDSKLHAGCRVFLVQFLGKCLTDDLPSSYEYPIKGEYDCNNSQYSNNFFHSDNLGVARKALPYIKTELFTNHDSWDYYSEITSRLLTKVNLLDDRVRDSRYFARLSLLRFGDFLFYGRTGQGATRLTGALPEDQLVRFRSSFFSQSFVDSGSGVTGGVHNQQSICFERKIHRSDGHNKFNLLTNSAAWVYPVHSVLNTPLTAECPAPDSRGFFTSIICLWPGSEHKYNTRKGNSVGRLLAVFKYLAASLNKGRFTNKTNRRPSMAAQSKSASARRKSKSVSQSKPIQLTREMISVQGWNAYHEFVGNLTRAEMRVVGHLRPMAFSSPQAVINEARRLLGESAAKCKIIPFPVVKQQSATLQRNA